MALFAWAIIHANNSKRWLQADCTTTYNRSCIRTASAEFLEPWRLFNDAIAGNIFLPWQLHPILRHERGQQIVHRTENAGVAMNLEMAVFLDGSNSLIFHITRHDA